MMMFGRRAEGGLSVNRPLSALPDTAAAPKQSPPALAPSQPPLMQTTMRSISYKKPLDAAVAAPHQAAAANGLLYARPLDSGMPMQQCAPAAVAFKRPLAAVSGSPLSQPSAAPMAYARPLDATNFAGGAGISFQRPMDASLPPPPPPIQTLPLPASRAYQRPLDAGEVGGDQYWDDIVDVLSTVGVNTHPVATSAPPVLAVAGASEFLFGCEYMPVKSLLTPDEIDLELKNLKELLDAGFLQGFQFEERKAELIRQKKFAFTQEIPHMQFGELAANVILDSMDDDPVQSKKAGNRNVRVFISSTFRDMGDEREAMLKTVFPAVQKACRERGVFLTAVDLRWGITSEQTSNAQTINVCLSEIDRCRPYFITVLGGRYGWAQPPSDHGGVDELLKRTHDRAAESFPWIRKFSNRSVTELEIRHALLNDMESETSRRGLVYVRKGAQDDDSRLTHLKKELQDVKNQGYLRAFNQYQHAEELKRLLTSDLMNLLNEDFPISETPSPLERERSAHDAFQESRCRLYISRTASFSQLSSHLLNPASGPITVLGEAGVGKSAFLCNWAIRYKRDNPEKLVITHYIGATAASTQLGQMLSRIMTEIDQFYQLGKEIPSSVTSMVEKFPEFLAEAGKRRGLVLVLDALDQLDPADGAHDLLWLPPVAPEGVRLILSAQAGPCLNVINRRKWKSMTIQPLSKEERNQLISGYMQHAGKKLTPEQSELIASASQTASPLFLRTLLEELRVFGSFEHLESKISHYLTSKTIPDLFEKVFERLEKDVNVAQSGPTCREVETNFVGAVLGLVFVSRKGITEMELLECLNLSQAAWSPLFIALEESLVSRSGYLSFFHDYMSQAVFRRYSRTTPSLFTDLRRKLATYFLTKAAVDLPSIRSPKDKLSPAAQRALEEVPYQYEQMRDLSSLRVFISAPAHFRALSSTTFRFDLVRYVRVCDGAQAIRNAMQSSAQISDMDAAASFYKELGTYDIAEEFYSKALTLVDKRDEMAHADILDGLGYVQRLRGKYVEAAQTLEQCLSLKRKLLKEDNPSLATSTNSLAIVLRKQGKYERAEALYNTALSMRLKIFGSMHADVAQSYNSLGCLHQDMGRFAEAEKNLLEAIRQRELLLGSNHPDVAMSLFNLGNVYLDWSRYQEAVPIYDRSLEIYEAVFGQSHPYVAQVLNSMAGVQQEMGQYAAAEKIYLRALQMRESLLGQQHPDVALTVNDIAVLYSRQSKFDEAVIYYKRALDIRRAVVGEHHPDYAQALKNLATVYQDLGRHNEALPLFEQTLRVYRNALGEKHPNVASAYTGLAGLKQQLRQFQECIPMYEMALEIYAALAGGAPDSDMALTLNDFAVLYFKMQNWPKAEETYLRSLDMYERCFGHVHPDVAQACINIGHFHVSRNDKEKAKGYFVRATEIYRDLFGTNHAKTLHALSLTSS